MNNLSFAFNKSTQSPLPVLAPPTDWLDFKFGELHKASPDTPEEQILKSVEAAWLQLLDGQPGMQKGPSRINFNLGKAHTYAAVDMNSMKYNPAVVVDYNENGAFVEQRVCTAPMVVKDPDNYDVKTFTLLVKALCDSSGFYGPDGLKRTQLMMDLTDGLRKRLKSEMEANKEAVKRMKAGDVQPKGESNWEKREKYFLGKSILWIDTTDLEPEPEETI